MVMQEGRMEKRREKIVSCCCEEGKKNLEKIYIHLRKKKGEDDEE